MAVPRHPRDTAWLSSLSLLSPLGSLVAPSLLHSPSGLLFLPLDLGIILHEATLKALESFLLSWSSRWLSRLNRSLPQVSRAFLHAHAFICVMTLSASGSGNTFNASNKHCTWKV